MRFFFLPLGCEGEKIKAFEKWGLGVKILLMKPITLIQNLAVILLVALAALLVAARLPIPGNYKVFTVISGSMEPALRMGSMIVSAPATDYQIGDIVTFGEISADKVPATHRIYDIKLVDGATVYITKGDANKTPDGRELPESEIFGKVLFSIPYLGYVLSFLRQPAGFALVIALPAAVIIFGEGRKIFGELKRKESKTTSENENQKEKHQN